MSSKENEKLPTPKQGKYYSIEHKSFQFNLRRNPKKDEIFYFLLIAREGSSIKELADEVRKFMDEYIQTPECDELIRTVVEQVQCYAIPKKQNANAQKNESKEK